MRTIESSDLFDVRPEAHLVVVNGSLALAAVLLLRGVFDQSALYIIQRLAQEALYGRLKP